MKNKYIFWLSLTILTGSACRKLPEKMDYLSPNASFNQLDSYEPYLGRTQLMLTQFNADGSTYPLEFSVENIRHADSSPAPEITKMYPVQEWSRNYTGEEKSLSEIEAKRIWTQKPFFQIREGSGDFIFWNSTDTAIRTYPDPGYLFDVRVGNKGNSRVIKDFVLRPLKQVSYAPYEYDPETGERKQETRTRLTPTGEQTYKVPFTIHPSRVSNIYYTKDSLFTDTLISVFFYKTPAAGSEGVHTLSFKFLDSRLRPIPPLKFKETKWDELVHGFNRKITDTTVSYEVAYPVPLTTVNTKYASGGQASVTFRYSRKGFGGSRVDAALGLNFAIYEPGDWTIIFMFRHDPIFEDD